MPPRTDGVFLLREPDSDSFIRFLPDGTVVSAATTGEEPIHEVIEWLVPGPNIAASMVNVDGDRIDWIERLGDAPDDLVEYRGRYADDHLLLDEYSHLTRWRGTGRRYAFMSGASIDKARATRLANRAERSANAKAARAAKKPQRN